MRAPAMLSGRICEIMRQKKMKQSLIAVTAGYDAKMFNRMLRGKRRIDANDVIKIARALEISPNELFGYVY